MRKQVLLSASFVAAALVSAVPAVAQSVAKGTVIDLETQEPIVGATVQIIGTRLSTLTDAKGQFVLRSPKKGKFALRISYVGYTSLELNTETDGEQDFGILPLSINATVLKDAVVTTRAIARKTPVALTTITTAMIEEKVGTADITKAIDATPGVYVTRRGGGFGDSEINMRGFKGPNVAVLVNGVSMNDMEWGGVYWSNWAGLMDVASSIQTQRGLGAAKVSTPSVGGSVNIVTKGTEAEKGGSFSYGMGNDGYNKLVLNLSTGKLDNGFAITALGARTWGDGYIQGTNFESWNYFLSVAKALGEDHQLSFTAFGAPQWHNQRSSYDGLTIEEWNNVQRYTQPGDNLRYNPLYGFDRNGQQRSASTNRYHKPQLQLQHIWQISEKSSLNSVLYLSVGEGGGSNGLMQDTRKYSWYGASNGKLNTGFRAKDGTFDYAAVQALNEASTDGAKMAMSESTNSHFWLGLVSTYTRELSDRFNFYGGIDLRRYVGKHQNKITDLYNGEYFVDGYYRKQVSQANRADAGTDEFVNQKLGVGDIVRRDWDGYVVQGGVFAQGEYDFNNLTAFLSGSANVTTQWRYDRFYYDAAHAESESVSHLGYTIKGGANYRFPAIDAFGGRHNVFGNVGLINRPPYMSALFINKDNSHQINKEAKSEKVFSFELGYGYHNPTFSAALNLYHTQWMDKAMSIRSSRADNTGQYSVLNLTGVNSTHEGVELELSYKPATWVSLRGMLSVGNWRWTNAASGYFFYADGSPAAAGGKVATATGADDHLKSTIDLTDIKVGGSAQLSSALAANFYPTRDIRLGLEWKHFANNYADFDPSVKEGKEVKYSNPWKLPAYSVFDLSAAYSFDFGGMRATLSGNVENLFDVQYINQATNGVGNDEATAQVFYGFGRTMSLRLKVKF